MSKAKKYLSWVVFAVALLLWGGVGYFVWTISSEEAARVSRTLDAEQESLQQSAAIRLHALARETKEARMKLEEIAHTDVIEILDAIEAVARDTGIPIGISQALSAPSSDSASGIHSVAFVVNVEGTFSEVTHAAALLESLPAPSLINELQFERLPAGSGSGKSSRSSLWRMVARMRFLTTADVSS